MTNICIKELVFVAFVHSKDTTSNLKHIIGPDDHGFGLHSLHVWFDVLWITEGGKHSIQKRKDEKELSDMEMWPCLLYLLIIRTCSSIRFPSPITIGPASAMICALGWTTVLAPEKKNYNQ